MFSIFFHILLLCLFLLLSIVRCISILLIFTRTLFLLLLIFIVLVDLCPNSYFLFLVSLALLCCSFSIFLYLMVRLFTESYFLKHSFKAIIFSSENCFLDKLFLLLFSFKYSSIFFLTQGLFSNILFISKICGIKKKSLMLLLVVLYYV